MRFIKYLAIPVLLAALFFGTVSADWSNSNSISGLSIPHYDHIVGEYLKSSASSLTQTLTEHWNGTNWLYVPSPNLGALGNTLYSVSASSSQDVWAVGFYTDSQYLSHTLTEHWNGKQWSIVSSPNPGSSYDNLFGVAAISPNDAWAVGFYRNDGDSNATASLIEHWNGQQWQVVPSPNPGSASNLLYGISAASANNIWAVGQFFNNSPDKSLVEHWNGSQWTITSSPSPGSGGDNIPGGIVAISAHDVWAVGGDDNGGNTRTLIEHFC